MGQSQSDDDEKNAANIGDHKNTSAELIMGADKSNDIPSSVEANTELNEDLLQASVPEIEQIPVVFRF
jgi:hypothetical protein